MSRRRTSIPPDHTWSRHADLNLPLLSRASFRYVDILGCHGVNLTNTDDYYARYTVSSICNGLVQSSKDDCNLSPENSRPLCADSCVRVFFFFFSLLLLVVYCSTF